MPLGYAHCHAHPYRHPNSHSHADRDAHSHPHPDAHGHAHDHPVADPIGDTLSRGGYMASSRAQGGLMGRTEARFRASEEADWGVWRGRRCLPGIRTVGTLG